MRELPVPDEPCPYCGYDRRAATFNRNHLPPGTVLHRRYVIGQALGLGSFGITYIGWDLQREERVTIKEFLPSAFAHHRAGDTAVQFYSDGARTLFEKGLRKFGDETVILHRLTDAECVSRIRDYVRENGTGYVVMEYLSGQTLKAQLAQCRTMSFPQAMEILSPVLRTLDEVHRRGLLHRDISPDNIFLCDDGRVKLLDFGSAQFELLQNSEGLSLALKHGYAPPEQYVTHMVAGPWTDVFGAAATLYKMLTGVVPPDALQRRKEESIVPPSELNCEIPSESQAALMRALSLRPEDRYATAEAFLSALEPQEEEKEKGRPTAVIAAVIAAVLIVGIALTAWMIHSRSPKEPEETTVQAPQTTAVEPEPIEVRETYYDSFVPQRMGQVLTASGLPASLPYFVFWKDGKQGLVGTSGNVVLEAAYSSIVWDAKQQLFLLDGSTCWDVMSGRVEPSAVVPTVQDAPDLTDSTYQYSDALYRVTADGKKYLQKDSEGAFLVGGPPYGVAVRGSLLVPQSYDKATPLSCGVSAFAENGQWTYRSAYGVDIFGRSFDGALYPNGTPYSFSEGVVPVQDDESGLWGFANTAGVYVVQPQYLFALPPMQGTAWVQTDRGFGTLRFTEDEKEIGGKCGENAQYVYSPATGLLVISGYGNLWDCTPETVPWLSYHRQIRTVQIESGIAYLGANLFADCTALSSVTLPADMTAIGPFAFRGCGMLRMLNLPPSLTYIGDEAFAGCDDLIELTLPDALQSMGVSAFRGCTALKSLTVGGKLALSDYAFYGCTALLSADLTSAARVGEHTFEGCAALQTVQFPQKNIAVGKYAFRNCTALDSIRIPPGVTTLETGAFRGCTSLRTVILPDGLRTIEQEAFADCTSLSGLSLPPTLTHICARAFYNCRGMQNAAIPDSVSRIDDYAFALCTGIGTFDLKDTVQTLGSHVFDGWTANQSIRLKNPFLKRWLGTPAGWSDDWNAGCSASITSG